MSSELHEMLDGPPPAAVASLPAHRLDELAALMREALDKQRAELAASFESTLAHVPFPLRTVIKKVLTA